MKFFTWSSTQSGFSWFFLFKIMVRNLRLFPVKDVVGSQENSSPSSLQVGKVSLGAAIRSLHPLVPVWFHIFVQLPFWTGETRNSFSDIKKHLKKKCFCKLFWRKTYFRNGVSMSISLWNKSVMLTDFCSTTCILFFIRIMFFREPQLILKIFDFEPNNYS